jgi:hypothetical protein
METMEQKSWYPLYKQINTLFCRGLLAMCIVEAAFFAYRIQIPIAEPLTKFFVFTPLFLQTLVGIGILTYSLRGKMSAHVESSLLLLVSAGVGSTYTVFSIIMAAH